MAFALSPILRFGPGGDFLSDVFADRLESSAPIAANESGDFDPGSSNGGPGFGSDAGDTGHRRASDSFVAAEAAELVSLSGTKPASALDGLELSDLARRAGGLLVAQRLLSLQASALVAAGAVVTSMLATIRRVSEPARTLRHAADRAEARQPDARPADPRPFSSPKPIANHIVPEPADVAVRSSRDPSLFSSRINDR
jgi:hypothetical protein